MPTPLKVLIAEDSPADAELVLRELRHAGFDPEWRRVDTEEDFLAQLHGRLDLVLADYAIPRCSGLRVLELLAQSKLDVPAIIISGKIGEETAVEAMKHGAVDYLLKDRMARLGPAVRHALEQTRLRREHKEAVMTLRRAEREQRELATQLATEKARLVAAQAVAKIGSWETNLSTMAILWSDETHHIFETDPEKFAPTHQRFLELVHPDDRTLVNDVFMRSLTVHATCVVEHRLLLPDGRIKILEERWQALHDGQGCATRAIGTCQDITERKHAEAALRASEQRFRTTLENLMEGCQILSRDLRYLYVNEVAARQGRRTVAEVTGQLITDVFPGIEQMPFFAIWRKCLEDGTAREIETDFRHADGSVTEFHLVIQPVPEGLFILSLDITARKQAERKIATQLAELLRWQEVMLGREERVHALKAEVNALLAQAHLPPRYGQSRLP